MTWELSYRLRNFARTSLVLWATASLALALCIAPVIRWLDRETGWSIFGYGADGARALLSVLVGSMLTFIVFVLSATLIVVQLANGQSSPRVIAMVLATPRVKFALAVLTFTYAFSLATIARIEEPVPDLLVSVAVLLNLTCLVVFFQFVSQLSIGLRPGSLISLVAERARSVIDEVYQLAFESRLSEQHVSLKIEDQATMTVDFSGPSGVVLAFSAPALTRLARTNDATIEMVPQIGDFIATGSPLFRVVSKHHNDFAENLRGCVAIGPERTIDQDPRFVFRVLVDIASKALSPAINDPTTAVLALDQIQHLLLILGRRHLNEGEVRDSDGKLRVIYGTPDWPDFVILAVSEVRQFGSASLQVHRRLRAMLEYLIAELPEQRRPPLREELALLANAITRNFEDAEDRKRASVPDFQGVGGSEAA